MKKALLISLLFTILGSVKLQAQSVIYSENFDASTTALPAGWSTYPAGGWVVDSTNSSFGYTNPSGFNNLVIKNLSPSNTYYLLSNPISTINYDSISVLWAARLTTHFPDSGSTVQGFDYSIDNGSTWSNLTYYENLNNSAWIIENGEVRIQVPSNAWNQPSVIFRWVVNIVNSPSGTYRIDDFDVQGNLNTGINEHSNWLIKLFTDADKSLTVWTGNTAAFPLQNEVKVFDTQGRVCFQSNLVSGENRFDVSNLQRGLYIAHVIIDAGTFEKKVFIR